MTIDVEQVKNRISQLNELSGVPLEMEMDALKETLLQNENILLLLLPEDIGEIVAALEKLTEALSPVKDVKKRGRPSIKGNPFLTGNLEDEDISTVSF